MLWIIISLIILIPIVLFYLRYLIPLRKTEVGFKYVYVKSDGTVWELDKEDISYLKEKFHPNDGKRPYIKSRYNERTPDGDINGFILRKRVPKKIQINNNVN